MPDAISQNAATDFGDHQRPDELLAVVERSPELVAVHDRAQWLDLFTDAAEVEDPVGSAPVSKLNGQLGRFWDTFIAPNQIRFEVRNDFFLHRSVARDVIIHTRIGTAVKIDVPAYLLYELRVVGGALRIERMRAHWNLAKLSWASMGLGPRAWISMTALFGRMLRRMGPAWVANYLSSLWSGVRRRAPDCMARLTAAVAARDFAVAEGLFSEDATVALGAEQVAARRLVSLFPAGSRLRLEAPIVAGWTIACRFAVDGPAPRQGLALIEFAPQTRRISRLRFFI